MYLDNIEALTNSQTILIAPLNWGLGHAARSLVLIQHLLKQGKRVGVASDGLSLTWLQEELKDHNLDFFELPGYDVDYNSSNMNWNMIRQYPKIQRAIKLENRITDKIVELWSPDLIISDNRSTISGALSDFFKVRAYRLFRELNRKCGLICDLRKLSSDFSVCL